MKPARFSLESDLYLPIKAFLEGQGYQVKGEVHGCDLVATRGAESPVIVELKLAFNMSLLLQGIDRLALTDHVYLAVPAPDKVRSQGMSVHRSDVRKLCRRLGLGLMTVMPTRRGHHVEVLLEPVPYAPRKAKKRLTRLLGEHSRREGDPNRGGVTRTPLMTAYRQEALRCALLIRQNGTATTKVLRASGVVPNATKILQADYYGWFERVTRGCYRITERAGTDIQRYEAAGTLPRVECVAVDIGAVVTPTLTLPHRGGGEKNINPAPLVGVRIPKRSEGVRGRSVRKRGRQ